MLETTKQFLIHHFRMVILRGYGWKCRKTNKFRNSAIQYRDPNTFVWVSEKAAMRLLMVQVMDEFQHR